ncbi:MAG TPA: ketoacyl-ACP synthase III [Pyrinomonadaceae bacterium]|nr:ketoacyl-ACP synthase III [Pyrinomonadaceae bacterium]
MYRATIKACSYSLPEQKIYNERLAETYGQSYQEKFGKPLTAELILKACGIRERRYVTDQERLRDLAARSIIKLLESLGATLGDIDCIILGTLTPESLTPSNASLILEELCKHFDGRGVRLTTYDINAACSGFLFGLEQAINYVGVGKKNRVIVCGAETMSRMLNGFDYQTGILFGDAAAAVLVERSEDDAFGINGTEMASVTDYIDDIVYFSSLSKDYDDTLRLKGTRVYKHGTFLTIDFVEQYLSKHKLTVDAFDYFIFHQSNIRMLRDISERLAIPQEKMLTNLEHVGNTAAASIPLCLAQFHELKTFAKGDRILLCSFGAGYTVGIVDLNWNL